MLLSKGPFHEFSMTDLMGLYIKILLIILFRKIRRKMLIHFEKWRAKHGEEFFAIEKKQEEEKKAK